MPVSSGPGPCPGFSHYLRVSDPRAAGGVAIRAWRTLGPSGRADARAVRPYSGGEGGAGRASRGIGHAGHTGGRTAFGRGCIRVLSSRAAAGYAQLGISLGALARQCFCIAAFPACVSCSQCSLCCISALGRGVAPAMPVEGRADARDGRPFGFSGVLVAGCGASPLRPPPLSMSRTARACSASVGL